MIIKAPELLPMPLPYPAIFLAGSIEQGTADDWQAVVTKALPWAVVLNPRRDDWDETWLQDVAFPPFVEQVKWELEALARADLILMWLEPGTKSPISLLEFGLYAPSRKIIVGCPPGFWRRGNVLLTAERYNVPVVATLDALAERAAERFGLA